MSRTSDLSIQLAGVAVDESRSRRLISWAGLCASWLPWLEALVRNEWDARRPHAYHDLQQIHFLEIVQLVLPAEPGRQRNFLHWMVRRRSEELEGNTDRVAMRTAISLHQPFSNEIRSGRQRFLHTSVAAQKPFDTGLTSKRNVNER